MWNLKVHTLKDKEQVATTFVSENQKDFDLEVSSRSPGERAP